MATALNGKAYLMMPLWDAGTMMHTVLVMLSESKETAISSRSTMFIILKFKLDDGYLFLLLKMAKLKAKN